jgi:hypothetical protein
MQKGHNLSFNCQSCQTPLRFSVFEIEKQPVLTCLHCEKKYSFSEETLLRQLKKFDALCRQIVESEEILSNTSVGIDIGEHHVQIPYKLLLARLNSSLELRIGHSPLTINFRIEPAKDLPAFNAYTNQNAKNQ